jgi:hypothetical protein
MIMTLFAGTDMICEIESLMFFNQMRMAYEVAALQEL